ncbi:MULTISPECIES: ABC transporter ATP-binding protein [Pseudothermotoga]|jgi:ABC-2 type transport system ATP-binding protein|uniref:ABC transporter related n=1 Tax=Pseudothermotoga lettingae (strain ATCC BAA-301 / DSM 14385 / NBRC 107922 / TMO) TaxID=416591 RepID=A8F623_PSELT|nr:MULTISPECIES: ABC transporter ATP-binding protein [Pseudothermotoga]ABV33607.1 ABC transporter related [Pseudothermotoga lettingae TMO]KUK20525.1 MAG: ABC transporter related [Pseudothermotoga lettingae]MDI3495059.1 type transport system ATP-binding protein [Pseudothermotoga sp.]MDK2883743.1 type transport system ATP-binding protein [Pseudothermotoga sp.]GLI49477.1 multidrug ABC transporter ATP-binding protein [Pseudothermotoga lettingae TMO]
MLAVSVKNVSKFFKRKKGEVVKAIENMSFDVQKGEIFGILGPNGSGKSTLIRMIATLLIPDEGSIKVFGHDVNKEPEKVRKLIHRVSVEASFFKKLSAYENLFFSAGIYGLSKKYALKKIHELMASIGFNHSRLKDPIEDFSRGMQQKVSIARAFLTKPSLLLLDEPTTGLDPRAKREVQELVHKASTEGSTILLSTHDMDEAYKLCHRIMIIHKGKLVVIGEPKKLVENLRKKYPNASLETVFFEYTGENFEQIDLEVV